MELFCTCGRGTELFAVVEISQLLNDKLDMISFRDGKVFFTVADGAHLDSSVRSLLHLKSVERIFISVLRQTSMKLFNRKQAVDKIKTEVHQVDVSKWESCLKLWNAVRSEDETKEKSATDTDDNSCTGPDNTSGVNDGKSLNCSRKRKLVETTFRVSAKCSGKTRSWFNSQTLSRMIGCEIARINGWTPELKRPEFEICVQLNHDGLTIGIPCTRIPLSCRPYMQSPGLRSTICSIMLSLFPVKPGMVLLDPMCGQGTILVEAAKMYPDLFCIGSDCNDQQCIRAMKNISYSKEIAKVQLLQANVSSLPLQSRSIDVIVCDIPFGIKHKVAPDVTQMFRSMLSSMDRVLKPRGRCILLCGLRLKDHLLKIVTELFGHENQKMHLICEERILAKPPTSSAGETGESVSDHQTIAELSRHERDFVVHHEDQPDRDLTVDDEDDMKIDQDKSEISGYDNGSVDNSSSQISSDIIGSTVLSRALRDGVDCHNRSTLNTIIRLHTNSLTSEHESCLADKAFQCKDNGSVWLKELTNYVKLGDMDAYICVFTKI